jgi:hypothetical protein
VLPVGSQRGEVNEKSDTQCNQRIELQFGIHLERKQGYGKVDESEIEID